MGGLVRGLALAGLIGMAAAGCGSPEHAVLASGSISSGEWAGRIYRDPFNGVCVEVVQASTRGAVCDLRPGSTSLMITDPANPGADYLVVADDRPGAASVEAVLDQGTRVGSFVADPDVSPLRFAFITVPGSRTVQTIRWLDANGEVVDITRLQ